MIHNIKIQPKITGVRTSSLKIYLHEIGEIPLLSVEDEIKYGNAALAGDAKAIDMLIKSNLRFVVSIAKTYNNHYNHLEDLINEGNAGLMMAAKKFDPSRGFKFISYAVWYIRGYIMNYLSVTSRHIRLPEHIIKNIYALEMLNRSGEFPTDEELEKIGIEYDYLPSNNIDISKDKCVVGINLENSEEDEVEKLVEKVIKLKEIYPSKCKIRIYTGERMQWRLEKDL